MNEMEQLEDRYQAIPPPGPERLRQARARVLTGITGGHAPARGGGRWRWPAAFSKLGRRSAGWLAPLAAAAAITAVIVGVLHVSAALRSFHPTRPLNHLRIMRFPPR